MPWLNLAIMIAVFAGSCFGLGYLAGLSVWKLQRGGLISGLMSLLIACVWPTIAVADAVLNARRHQSEHPGELNDAPGMVLMSVISVGVPVLFMLSLPLAFFGAVFARHRYYYSKQRVSITTQGAAE